MKRPTLKPFRRLQWRLTFSFTLVTVAALLVVELTLLAGTLALLNSNLLINALVETMRDSIAPQVQPYLESSPIDLQELNLWLSPGRSSLEVNQGTPRFSQGLNITFSEEGTHLFVLDKQRVLLGQTTDPAEERVTIGQPFTDTPFPELERLITVALEGEIDTDQLYTRLPDNTLLMALPVLSLDDQVLGVVALTLRLPSFNMATLGPLGRLLFYSAIFFTLAAGFIGTLFGYFTARNLSRRLDDVATAATAWSQGDFSAVTGDHSGDEIGQLSRRLNQMAEQLQNLLQTRKELATMEERNRLARDLHDSVKQQVFATTMQISTAKALMKTDPDTAQQHLQEAEQLSRQSQQELAGLIQELRPAALAGKGLVEALQEYTNGWSRRTHIQTQLRIQGKRPLPLTIEQALFRVAQEALSNVEKHSHAQTADIHLAWDNDHFTLTISDDGCGFDVEKGETAGYGTQTMRERVQAVNGRLTVESAPGAGSKVIAQIKRSTPSGAKHE